MSAPVQWNPLLYIIVLPIFLVFFILVGIPFGIVYWMGRAIKKIGLKK
jgi:hypothetical protein